MISGISGSGGGMQAMMSQMQTKMFKKGDADGSGGIDAKEFGSMVQNSPMGKAGISSEDQTKQFNKMDVDGNGSLTQAEMETGMKDIMSQFQSTMQSFGGGSGSSSTGRGSSDDALQSLLDSIGKSSEASNKKKSEGVGDNNSDTASLQKMLEQLISKLNSTYATDSNTPQLSLQA
jgi:Ca2+-binding EF-hand superfamily protein